MGGKWCVKCGEPHLDEYSKCPYCDFPNVETPLKLQIIHKNINISRLLGEKKDEREYFNRIRAEIKRQIIEDSDELLIEIIPSDVIKNKWILELLINLQAEFTSKIILPESEIELTEKELGEIQLAFGVTEYFSNANNNLSPEDNL